MMKLKIAATIVALVLTSSLQAGQPVVQIVAWDFFGEANQATSTPDLVSPDLDVISVLSRGAGAPASAGANSFRTQGFQNDGISVTNTDYFEFSLSASAGNTMSLTRIDIRTAGTSTYAASPGVSHQWAYSFDGTNFTLIGTPVITVGTPQTATFDLSGTAALQNLPDTTTVTLRYYASGQTSTGGWGFNSPAAGSYGLELYGTGVAEAIPEPSTYMLLGVGLLFAAQRFRRSRKG